MDASYYKNEGTCELSYQIDDSGYKLIGIIDSNILNYYYKLIPKYYNANKPRYKAHISFVRKERPLNLDLWGRYDKEIVKFYYSSLIRECPTYLWIDCYCKRAMDIREELGLKPQRFMSFHFTVANTKGNI